MSAAGLAAVQSAEDLETVLKARQESRLIYWFNTPPSVRDKTGIQRLGFVELSGREMTTATKRGNLDQVETAFELAKEALRFVDDKRTLTADGTADAFWASNSPGLSMVRQLAMAAYAKIHSPEKGETVDFLASMSIQTG